MTTNNSPRSRILIVWLVLVAFFCAVVLPSLAIAKEDMAIATEGDPTDGLDSTGGGSGSLDDGSEEPSPSKSGFASQEYFNIHELLNLIIVPVWENGRLTFIITSIALNEMPTGVSK